MAPAQQVVIATINAIIVVREATIKQW